MRLLEPWHLLVVTAVFLLLFGAKRLPDSARSLGESLHVFRKALHEPAGTAGPEPGA
ncbi:MAG TPA: twin-arginine translocase TatA/TatE family subunit [Sporichthyaceae bacterium]|jgi:sec-independent protein translocase protein TatA|nr:twin-arginine translocase TatA/TatE family subunit [Sporichthyaceae bacterium]